MEMGPNGYIEPTGKRKGKAAEINRRLKRPNAEQTPYEFKYQIVFSLKTWGNAFVSLTRDNPRDIPSSMIAKNPYKVRPIVESIDGYARVTKFDFIGDVQWASFKPYQICQIQDVISDGVTGESILLRNVDKVRELIQIDNFILKTFSNSARISGIVVLPTLRDETDQKIVDSIIKDINTNFTLQPFSNKAGSVFVTGDPDTKFIPTNMMGKPADMEMMALRRQLLGELSAAYGLSPAHTAADMATTFNNKNLYQQSFFRDAVYPTLINIEEALTRSLITEDEVMSDEKLRIVFDTSSLVKGDLDQQMRHAEIMASTGCFTKNEIRSYLGHLPVAGGDEFAEGAKPREGQDQQPVEPAQDTGRNNAQKKSDEPLDNVVRLIHAQN